MTKSKADYFFVGGQLCLFIAFILPFRWHIIHFSFAALNWALMLFGFTLILWAFIQLKTNFSPWPSPKPNGDLVQTGVFKYLRHPIYSGIILMLGGWALRQQNLYQLLVVAGLLVLFYFKASYEEKQLCKKFPTYKEYQQKTGRFVPKLRQ